jgi:Maltose operon periplasmic protein precursor (MalM)
MFPYWKELTVRSAGHADPATTVSLSNAPRRVSTVAVGMALTLWTATRAGADPALAHYVPPSAAAPAAEIVSASKWGSFLGRLQFIDGMDAGGNGSSIRVAPGEHRVSVMCVFAGISSSDAIKRVLLTGVFVADRKYYVRCARDDLNFRSWLAESPDGNELPQGFSEVGALAPPNTPPEPRVLPAGLDLSQLAFLTLDAGHSLEIKIGDASPTFEFPDGASHYAAFALPDANSPLHLDLKSWFHGDVFFPRLLLLDAEHRVVRTIAQPDVRYVEPSWFARGHVLAECDFMPHDPVRYLVIYSSAEDLGEKMASSQSGSVFVAGKAVGYVPGSTYVHHGSRTGSMTLTLGPRKAR